MTSPRINISSSIGELVIVSIDDDQGVVVAYKEVCDIFNSHHGIEDKIQAIVSFVQKVKAEER